MPCKSYDYDPEVEAEASRVQNIVWRLACDRCRELEKREGKVPEWAESWWQDHKKHDAHRMQEEAQARKEAAIRQRALAKLTPEEREELGV